MNFRSGVVRAAVLALCSVGTAAVASANTVSFFDTEFDVDYKIFGYAGMRDVGTGNVTVAGVTGPVSRAILTWHGPTQVADPTANATVTFNGTSITGTNIGLSQDNNWGFANSQAYSADVTGLVAGDGAYTLANFLKDSGRININGVSLQVFYDDGDDTNNRDIVMFHGNDSNIPSVFDPLGWQAALNGINYSGGPASLVLTVSDGQDFGNDEAATLNGNPFIPAGATWQGNTLPAGPGGPANGDLFDIRTFDIASFLSPGINNLNLNSGNAATDALGLIGVAFDLPAGAAPPIPEPAMLSLLGLGVGFAARRRMRARRSE